LVSDQRKQGFALSLGELLRVAEAADPGGSGDFAGGTEWEHDGGSDDRTGQWTAAHLVDASDTAGALAPEGAFDTPSGTVSTGADGYSHEGMVLG
jgi:hypothetical protein